MCPEPVHCLNRRMPQARRHSPRPDRVAEIVLRLESAYGRRELSPDGDPLSTLVETILSQNTSDANSGRAFRSLKAAFPRWEDVAAAAPEEISAAIRAGGLAEIKGRRIKRVLETIRERRGDLALDFLRDMPLDSARDWLKDLPGVGDKTAACVLLFSFGLPLLPVDTHIHRVSKRLGLVGGKVSAEEAHVILRRLVPCDLVYSFHVLIIQHGRRICRARSPDCPACALGDICPSFAIYSRMPRDNGASPGSRGVRSRTSSR